MIQRLQEENRARDAAERYILENTPTLPGIAYRVARDAVAEHFTEALEKGYDPETWCVWRAFELAGRRELDAWLKDNGY